MATLNFDLEQSVDFVPTPSARDFIDSESQRATRSTRTIDQQNWSRKLVQNVVTSGGLSYVVTGFNPAAGLAGAAGGAITTLAEYMTTSGQQYFRGQHLLTEFAVHSSQVLLQTGVNTALKRTAETAVRSFTSFFAGKVSGYASDKILSYTKLKENQFVRAVTNTAVSLGVGYAVDAATTATMNGVKYVLAHQSATEAPATTPSQTDGTTTQPSPEATTQQAQTTTEPKATIKPDSPTKPPQQSTTHSTTHTPSSEAATTHQETTTQTEATTTTPQQEVTTQATTETPTAAPTTLPTAAPTTDTTSKAATAEQTTSSAPTYRNLKECVQHECPDVCCNPQCDDDVLLQGCVQQQSLCAACVSYVSHLFNGWFK